MSAASAKRTTIAGLLDEAPAGAATRLAAGPSHVGSLCDLLRERPIAAVASLAGLYFVFALMAIELQIGLQASGIRAGTIAPLWCANAIGACVLLASPLSRWPLAALGAALANLLAGVVAGSPWSAALPYLPANLAEMLCTAALLRRSGAIAGISRSPRECLSALAVGAVLAPVIGASIGAGLLVLEGAPFGATWLDWYQASLVGAVSVLPFGLALLSQTAASARQHLLRPDALACLLLAAATAALALRFLPYPFVYIALPLMLAAGRQRFIAVALTVLVTALSLGAVIAHGGVAPPSLPAPWRQAAVYFPLLLMLLPPLLLSASREQLHASRAELAEREQRQRALYCHTPALLQSMGGDGRLQHVSDLWLERLGYAREHVLGTAFTDLIATREDREAFDAAFSTLQAGGRCRDLPLTLRARDGSKVDILLSATLERDDAGPTACAQAVLEDVSLRNRLAAELSAAQRRIEQTLRSVGDAVVSTDAQGRVRSMNPMAEHLCGWEEHAARGRALAEVLRLIDERDGAPLPDPLVHCLGQRSAVTLPPHTEVEHRDGRRCGVQCSATPLIGEHGRLLGAVLVLQDVTQARALNARMAHMAQHDTLTGLPNRALLADRLEQRVHGARRQGESFGLMVLDIDHFKRINESLGHAVGDALLAQAADRLVRHVRASDSACRVAGDRFAILMSQLAEPTDAAEVAAKLLHALAPPYASGDRQISLSFSVGIALFPGDGDAGPLLMRHADAALQRAKRDGGGRCHFYSPQVDQAALDRQALESDMRRGLAAGHFQLHYQPIVDGASEQVLGMEALLRWQRNGSTPVSPADFIPIAESCGLIVPLGDHVLRVACAEHALLVAAAGRALRMCVNISAVQFAQLGFVESVADALDASGMPPSQLELEITESSLMADPEQTTGVLTRLRALGVGIAIDDFGTGYSSLSYLKRFPVDTLKIDRSFVRDLEHDVDDREIVTAIVRMAKSLRLSLIAEGVENVEQQRLLAALGCEQMQGYLFARAMPLEALQEHLSAPQGRVVAAAG